MGARTAATAASLNTAFCSLASSALLGWQKANPELSAASLSSEKAFRLIVGSDRNLQALFDSNYPKVRERHLVLSASGENALLVAADHLMERNLLPGDAQRGELLQLSLNPNPPESKRSHQREALKFYLIEEIRDRFPFVQVPFDGFENGRLVRITLHIQGLDEAGFRSFFLSEHGRFVAEAMLARRTAQTAWPRDEHARAIREWATRTNVKVNNP